ncbi:DinB family protein [Actinoplanes sp. NPDC049599]|uniref:DinB family protein n=1 Tax=Actinoplanes sp. NPDC049599 TaxID=3363903 RepID=UPI0037B5C681
MPSSASPPGRRRRTADLGPPETGAGEQATLLGVLDYLRAAVAGKVADVPEPAVRAGGVPSGTNLLGLIKHLTAVERFYFLGEPIGNLRGTLRPAAGETVDGLLAAYRQTGVRVNQVVEACTDLALPAPRPPGRGRGPSMRWALVHLIEETARHAGHADILREQIDGSTGR